MNIKHIFTATILIACAGYQSSALAYEYNMENVSFKLSGYGNAGMIETHSSKPDFLGDWLLRSEVSTSALANNKLGLVYALDAIAIDEQDYMREAFGFWQNNTFGRIELGFTDSVARKLGLGIPDVGGLRLNDQPLLYKKINPTGAVIADSIITTGRQSLRINMVSVPMGGKQYGLSLSGITDNYDYALDGAIKIRFPHGKTKTAFSLAASFMDNLKNYKPAEYSALVNADWRAQLSGGVNVQYNSWMFGANARVIYDQNPTGIVSDGLALGAGISYDLLNYTVSLSYLMSDTGIWDKDTADYLDHSAIASFRYKYSKNVDGWMSAGISSESPFLSVGMRITF